MSWRNRTLAAVAVLLAVLAASCSGGGDGEGGDGAAEQPATEGCPGGAGAFEAETVDDLPGGPLATGRPGDIVLFNDQVEVVVQAPGRNNELNPYGGNIIDADIRREEDGADAFGEVGLFVNLAGTNEATDVTIEADGADCEDAVVVATGKYVLSDFINPSTAFGAVAPGVFDDVNFDEPWPLEFRVEYRLGRDDGAVHMRIEAENTGDEPVPYALAYLAHGGLVEPFRPTAEGFTVTGFGNAEQLWFEGDDQTYAVVPLTDDPVSEHFYAALVGGYAIAHDATTADVLGFPGSTPTLAPGETEVNKTLFVVAPDFDAARQIVIDEAGQAPCTPVSGRVLEEQTDEAIAGADVTAIDVLDTGEDGADIVQGTTDRDGSFSLCVPPGPVRLIAGQDGRPYAGGDSEPERVDVDVTDTVEPVELRLPPTGRFQATVTDAAGDGLPSRVVIVGVDPSPHSYRLSGDGFDPLPPGVAAAVDGVDGSFDFPLEPGEYDAVFTHGPEYDQVIEPFVIEPDDRADLDATLHRVVDTTGYLSGDFHVHAQAGPDSTVSNRDRVANMAAEGVEVLVATDHVSITDYQPQIDALDLAGRMVTVPGQEVTTFDYGHFGMFPLARDPDSPTNGAIDWVGQTPDELAGIVEDADPAGVIQVNHPRAIPAPAGTGNYFTLIDLMFDENGPYVGPDAVPPEDKRLQPGDDLLSERFTAMEIMTWLNVQGLADWTNFLNAGITLTATGNSDTHTTRVESSGWPRNYVRVGIDDPADFDQGDFVSAIRAGANTVSFGPFVTLEAEGGDGTGQIGDTVTPDAGGAVTLTARVQAPTWLPYDTVTVYEGSTGRKLVERHVEPEVVDAADGESERLETTLTKVVHPEEDAWYTIIVTGRAGLFPGVPYNESDPTALTIERLRAGDVVDPATPFGITNPVWVDVDGDGEVTPSHLVLPDDHTDFRAEDRTTPYGR